MGLISKPATCACGQVIYETADAFTGSLLTCSWCERHYRYLGKSKLQPLSNSEYEAALIAPPYQERVAAASESAPAEQKPEPNKKTEKLIEPATPSRIKLERAKRDDGSGIPGGVLPMIAFIIAFNAIAFVVLAYALPRNVDGSRILAWNHKVTIPKSVIPDVVALVAGHFFGFLAWAIYVYRKHYRNRDQRPGANPLKPLEIES